MNETENRVKEIVATYMPGRNAGDIANTEFLANSPEERTKIVRHIVGEFSIEIRPDVIQRIYSVQDVIDYVSEGYSQTQPEELQDTSSHES